MACWRKYKGKWGERRWLTFVHHHHNQCANSRQVRSDEGTFSGFPLFMLRMKVQAINFECSTIDWIYSRGANNDIEEESSGIQRP
jgi:hypothetical protein